MMLHTVTTISETTFVVVNSMRYWSFTLTDSSPTLLPTSASYLNERYL